MIEHSITFSILYVIGLVDVFSKAYQQQNVTYGRYKSIIFLSYIMSSLDTLTIIVGASKLIEGDYIGLFLICLARGTGAWNGCWAAMWLFKKFHRK